MTDTFTLSTSTTFTVTDARRMAAKVATDLKRIQRFYGKPSDSDIADFENEAIELLRYGYLATVIYGFQRDGKWITPTVRYTAQDLAFLMTTDDDPGRIPPNADVTGAWFCSYLTHSSAWHNLPNTERDAFEKTLAVQRSGAAAPGVSGYFANDLTYSSGGRSLARASVRSY